MADCGKNGGRLDYSTPESANEIAHLMRYLGVTLKADYKNNGTTIDSDDAISWINDWTRLNATSLKSFNEGEILVAAGPMSNNLVYMRGNTGRKRILGITIAYTGGHAWVIDGAFSATRKSDKRIVNLFHCNWGWAGDSNGYFLANTFDTDNSAISDYEMTRSNFKYNIEYSIVHDPNIPDNPIIL